MAQNPPEMAAEGRFAPFYGPLGHLEWRKITVRRRFFDENGAENGANRSAGD